MSKKANKLFQPETPFVPLPRSLLKSTAWRSLNVHAKLLIEFLMNEYLDHGGKENGQLLAPRRQLEQFGVGSHFVSRAIADADRVGLIDVCRGTGRAPNRYTLTWLPIAGRFEPTNRWRHCDEQAKK